MIDEKTNDEKGQETKKIYNQFLDDRTETRKNTQFKKEDVFRGKLGKDSISQEQLTEPKVKQCFEKKYLPLKKYVLIFN